MVSHGIGWNEAPISYEGRLPSALTPDAGAICVIVSGPDNPSNA